MKETVEVGMDGNFQSGRFFFSPFAATMFMTCPDRSSILAICLGTTSQLFLFQPWAARHASPSPALYTPCPCIPGNR